MSNSIEVTDANRAHALETPHDLPNNTDTQKAPSGWQTAISWLPSLLVFAMLAGIGWYGHKHNWKLPTRTAATAVGDVAWCDSHGVAEAECIVCRPELIEAAPKLTYCKLHGVHGCVYCDPSLAQTKRPAEPTPADLERAERALALRPRKENLSIGSSPGARIQFASIAAISKAGVDVEPVQRQAKLLETIPASGEILYDGTRTAQVSPQADGIVREVLVEVGDWVKQGEVLAVIDSTQAGQLKSQLLAALADERLQVATVRRVRPLAGESVAAKRLQESENALRQATSIVDRAAGALKNLGIEVNLDQLRGMEPNEAERDVRKLGFNAIDASSTTGTENHNLIAVIAPLEGRVVKRSATLGQVVNRGSELIRVVDTRSVWLDLRVAAEEAPLVTLGQRVHFLPDGQRQQRAGEVTWISSEVDPQTRTVRVRAELANPDHKLRNESFGQGQIVLREETDAIVVADTAVQWDGAGQVVFVRDAKFFEQERPKFFVTRSVRTGVRQDGVVEIIAGLLPGEVVATSGSDVLRAQLLRSNLGAGCTCGQ